jgi:predicted phosphodiesterase
VRYAVISDIHANLEALQVVLDDIDGQNVDSVVCLGDIVGYYANPNECAELCRSRSFLCLRGNHDDAVVGICGIEDFNPIAQEALLWTECRLTSENKEWLSRLPEQALVDDRFLAVHGSPLHPYDYIFSLAGAAQAFDIMASLYPGVNICFFGHTHQRALYSYDYRTTQEFPEQGLEYPEQDSEQRTAPEFDLTAERLYLINPGSIGQARDGKPGASYLIFDVDKNTIAYRHVPYDFNQTQRKVAAAGLPPMLAERLGLGF